MSPWDANVTPLLHCDIMLFFPAFRQSVIRACKEKNLLLLSPLFNFVVVCKCKYPHYYYCGHSRFPYLYISMHMRKESAQMNIWTCMLSEKDQSLWMCYSDSCHALLRSH